MHQPVENRVAGVGNIDTYLNEIRTLQSLGVALKQPIHEKGSHALNFYLPNCMKLDAICDHNLSPFLVKAEGYFVSGRAEVAAEYQKIYGYYHSQLKPGGKLILQTNNFVYGIESDFNVNGTPIKRIISEAGFRKVDYFEINDVFEFKIPRANLFRFDDLVYIDRWRRSHYSYDYDYNGEEVIIRISLTGKPYGVRHPSPDIYVSTK